MFARAQLYYLGMQIYIEYVIADNMAVNMLLIYATAITLRRKFSTLRAVVASAAGTAFAVLMPLWEIKALFIAKIVLALIMSAVMLKHKDAKSYVKCLTFFLLYTFLTGGICVALLGANDSFIALRNPDGYTPAIVAVSAFICLFAAKKLVGYVTLARREKKYIADVKLVICGETTVCKGYWDSGNRLFYKGILPVVVSGAGFARTLPNLDKAEKVEGIKLSTVAGNKTIKGFIADKLYVSEDGVEKEFDNVVIGVGENDFKGFSLLLNCDL